MSADKQLSTSWPLVSVVIPVYNDQGLLKHCLQSLKNQTYPPDKLEILVVDNGHNPDIHSALPEGLEIILLKQSKPGSYVARNTAIAAATGKVFAFIDADIVADRGWIEEGVKALIASPNTGLVGGRVEFTFDQAQKPTLVELCDSLLYFDQQHYIENEHYSGAGNLFTYRSVLTTVGHFSEQLKSGGDREWGNRVYNAGLTLTYAKDAIVYHPARRTLTELLVKAKRVSGGNTIRSKLFAKSQRQKPLLFALFYGFTPPIAQMRMVNFRLRTSRHKLIPIFVLMTLLKYVRTIEMAKVRLGAGTRR